MQQKYILLFKLQKQNILNCNMGSDSGHPGILDTINLKWFYHKFEVEIPRAKFKNAKKSFFLLMNKPLSNNSAFVH